MLVLLSSAGLGADNGGNPLPLKALLAGAWSETTTVAGGPTFQGVLTFEPRGGLIASYQGNVTTSGPAPIAFTAAHGQWVHEGGRTFSTTALQLVSGFDGQLVFVNKLRQRITVNRAGTRFTSVVRAEFYDPIGTLLFVSEGTTEGRRIGVDALP
jgi:hypothetical protein